jgi:hypothetical protein
LALALATTCLDADPLSCKSCNTASMLQQQHMLVFMTASLSCALLAGSPPHERALAGHLVNAASGC